MYTRQKAFSVLKSLALGSLIFTLVLSGCTLTLVKLPFPSQSSPTPAPPTAQPPTPQPSAAVTFRVVLPSPLLAGEVLYVSVVDEVTGLGLNPVNHAMQGMDSLHYAVTIPFALNSIVKYRYMRQGNLPILEDTSANKVVRYRLYFVTGPGSVEDVVSAWSDSLFNSPYGRVSGQVVDSSNNTPIPNILIAAGGEQTLSDSSGNFSLEALPAGTHNLVAYALDGAYQTFQQGARVEAGKPTQVSLSLTPAKMVDVTFTVSIPGSQFKGLPLRLAGNLYQLGDTFADLQGGLSTVAARMPLLSLLPDGRYSLTLSLPVGADIRYKYTLGDGFWNAEHGSDGAFVLRQLVVQDLPGPIKVQDAVTTWQSGPDGAILFELNVPPGTPQEDVVSIQFNPYGWTEPIPMWPRGNNQWVYQLYGPLNILGDLEYRYCRNDQCGVADDVDTAPGRSGRPLTTTLARQDFQDTVSAWNWFQPQPASPLVGLSVTRRASGFWAGVEFLPQGNPTWQTWNQAAVGDVKSRNANWLVLTPSWSVGNTNPLVFSAVPGADALWPDNLDTISAARAAGLSVALFPQANLPAAAEAWWLSTPRDSAWWDAWFNRYTAFAANHADMATKAGAQALVLGGDWVAPALPGGQLKGADSGVPADAEARWIAIFTEVRRHFSGQVLWAATYPGGLETVPAFAKNLDGIYLLWSAPLNGSSVDDLKAAAGGLLDTDIQPFQAQMGKPVILAVAYASVDGAAGATIPLQALFQPGTAQGRVNLQAQEDVYQALMMAINERDWVSGIVSRGYYPPTALQDGSASIHGKPVEDLLWYWFGHFLGTIQ